MAVRRKKTKSQLPITNDQIILNDQVPMIDETEVKKPGMGKWGWAGIVVALLCVYWWKTNTWPVIAVVGMKPIYRHTVNQELYKQGGKSVVDNMVTERLVQIELNKGGVSIGDDAVNLKLDEIKKNFPSEEEFQTALSSQNLTLVDLKKQIGIQMGIEKLLSEKVEVTASETAELVKSMGSALTATDAAGKQMEAEKILRDQKLQQEIAGWIEEIRTKGKVWWIGKV